MLANRVTPVALVVAVPLLAGCGAPETAPVVASVAAPQAATGLETDPLNAELAACGPVTAAGYCGVTFGMTPQEAKSAFPVALVRYSADVELLHDSSGCFEMFAAEPVQGVSFLAESDKVGRVDVMSPGPVTADGFGVGSPTDQIRAKYGAALQEGPNKYEPEIIELTVTDGEGKILFEIQDGKVRAWRAGLPPLIDYVERCG